VPWFASAVASAERQAPSAASAKPAARMILRIFFAPGEPIQENKV
jgi:hypothetical protein